MRKYTPQDPDLPQGFTVSFQNRFWSKVNKHGPQPENKTLKPCWIWTGSKNEFGYGQMQRGQRGAGLIRATWASLMLVGIRIPEGQIVLHRCDNPSCVNPDHLFTGSHWDNVHDKISKGRAVVGKRHNGENHHNSKLSWEQVQVIRWSKQSNRKLAKIFGIDDTHVGRIKRFLSWKAPATSSIKSYHQTLWRP